VGWWTTDGLPFEALFAARDALFGPILVAQSGELVRQVAVVAAAPRRDPTQVSAEPWPGRLAPVHDRSRGAAFHDHDPQEDVHHVKKWTPARGYEVSTRSMTI
jgi:hypothetical protein